MKLLGKVLILGGDKRQLSLHERLCDFSEECRLCGFSESDRNTSSEIVSDYEIIVLPLPLSRDGVTLNSDKRFLNLTIEDIANSTHRGQIIFAGALPIRDKLLLEKNGAICKDYYTDEHLLEYNCALTAQGLLMNALENIQRDIRGLPVLITGYGRLGKATANIFGNCGFDVSVAARSEESLALIRRHGFNGINLEYLEVYIEHFAVIINTIPSRIINTHMLENTDKEVLLLEGASLPYGFDAGVAATLGRKSLLCSSLPGKITPISAGEAIAETIIRMFGE